MSRTDEEIDEVLREIPDGQTPNEHVDDRELVAYARQRLGEAEREVVEAHLVHCGECRALVAEYGAPIPAELKSWAKDALPTRRARRWPIAVGGLVAAAAVLVVLLPRPADVALPGYTLDTPAGGVVPMRGADDEGDVFVPTSRIRWLLRPDAKSDEPVRLRVFVASSTNPNRIEEIASPSFDRGASGIIRFETNAETILGRDFGSRTLHLVVVPAGDPTTKPYVGDRDALELGPHRWLTSRIDYRASPPEEEPR